MSGLTLKQRAFIQDEAGYHLDQIRKIFKNPKLTLIVRCPDVEDGDVILTEDTAETIIASVEKTLRQDKKVTVP